MAQSAQIQKVRAWHEELLEFILAHPRANLAEIAFYFNVSQSWVSIVKNSDAFQELWAQRRGEHFSRVSSTVSERVTALAEISLDALTDKIVKEVNEGTATTQTLKEVGELALKSMGFGTHRNVGGSQIQNNIVFADRDALREAREKMAQLRHEKDKLIHDIGAQNAGDRKSNGNVRGDSEKTLEGEILYPSEKLR